MGVAYIEFCRIYALCRVYAFIKTALNIFLGGLNP